MKHLTLSINTILSPDHYKAEISYLSGIAQGLFGVDVKITEDSCSNNNDVEAFHARFHVPQAKVPSLLGGSALKFRTDFLQEELNEFHDATAIDDLLAAGDALIDLAYVTHGTALMMGLPWASMWNEVHRKNMEKIRAETVDQSKRKTTMDVIKPAGWTPPDHSQFIGKGPWPTFFGDQS